MASSHTRLGSLRASQVALDSRSVPAYRREEFQDRRVSHMHENVHAHARRVYVTVYERVSGVPRRSNNTTMPLCAAVIADCHAPPPFHIVHTLMVCPLALPYHPLPVHESSRPPAV